MQRRGRLSVAFALAGLAILSAPPVSAGDQPCTIRGTAASDRLRGTPGREVICGLAGNDRLFGFRGDDRIRGGRGADLISGGPGADNLGGGHGYDSISGGRGADRLAAQESQDGLPRRWRRATFACYPLTGTAATKSTVERGGTHTVRTRAIASDARRTVRLYSSANRHRHRHHHRRPVLPE